MSHVSTMFSIRKNATGQGDDYKTGCLSDYSYFKKNLQANCNDSSEQQALDREPNAI